MTASTVVPSDYSLIGSSDNGQGDDLLAGLSAKNARQRLQALIAEWLHMENLIVLAGAGTSVSSGGKVMIDLEDNIFATLKAMDDLPKAIGQLIDARTAARASSSNSAILGFEDWLSYLVNANFIGSASNSPFAGVTWKGGAGPTQAELSWFVDRVGKAIFAECALALPDVKAIDGTSTIPPHLPFLAKAVARDSNLGRVHLFTLNYDTLFEQALELLGIQYFDGFSGRADL